MRFVKIGQKWINLGLVTYVKQRDAASPKIPEGQVWVYFAFAAKTGHPFYIPLKGEEAEQFKRELGG